MNANWRSAVNYLRISITDRCNFQCRYCMPEGKREFLPREEILTYEEVSEVVSVFSEFGVRSVRLTGGEPLVRKGIEKLILQLKEIEGIKEVSITTNGFMLGSKAGILKKAGLDRVNISLDTLNPVKFAFITRTSEDTFYRVLEGVEKAKEEELNPVKINTVLIKGFNDSEVEDFVKFSIDYGVEVRFIELMPVGGEFFGRENFVPVSYLKNLLEKRFGRLEPVKTVKMGPARSFKVADTGAVVGFIPSISQHFCFECNRLRLTSDGKLRLCLMLDEEVDLKSVLRSTEYSRDLLREKIREALVKKKSVNGIEALESLGCSRKMFTIGG